MRAVYGEPAASIRGEPGALATGVTAQRAGKLNWKYLLAIGLLAIIVGAVGWFIAADRIAPSKDLLPDIDEISEMDFSRADSPFIKIPRDRWNDVLSSLHPADRRRDPPNQRTPWEITVDLKIVTRSAGIYEITVFNAGPTEKFDIQHRGVNTICAGGDREQLKKILSEIKPEPLRGKPR